MKDEEIERRKELDDARGYERYGARALEDGNELRRILR
jgi:hypothetical protein